MLRWTQAGASFLARFSAIRRSSNASSSAFFRRRETGILIRSPTEAQKKYEKDLPAFQKKIQELLQPK
jgi:hypothetical protein